MALSAARASAGWVSMTRLPTPAWIAMMPMLCATMSWSSRAIRSRSAVTACDAAREASSSACLRRSRIELPAVQAAAIATRTSTAAGLLASHGQAPVNRVAAPSWAASVSTAAMIEDRRGWTAAMRPTARSVTSISR